jgi:hypothetical protein
VKPSSLTTSIRNSPYRPALFASPGARASQRYFDFFDFFAIAAVSAPLSFCTSASSSGRESCRILIACRNCGVITS